VRLAGRLFVGSGLVLGAVLAGLLIAIDGGLRRRLEGTLAQGLEREAHLVATLLPADSLAWPGAARRLGTILGHRVTLIDPTGRVRGDTEFGPGALDHLENQAHRPEVSAAIATGTGRDRLVDPSTNERLEFVAVRGGPPGLAVVRVSAPLDAVDAIVGAADRGVALAGLAALAGAALVAWRTGRMVSGPLAALAGAARAIAGGEAPRFADTRLPEIAEPVAALRAMSQELGQRFAALRHEREETQTLIEAMADGVLAADAAGNIVLANTEARRLIGYSAPGQPPPLSELFHDKRPRDLVRAVLGGYEIELQELDLEGRALLVTGRALPNGGALLVFRDVTALRRLEAVRRDFVANVSHELKTPLTSIAGYAETLAAEVHDNPQARRFADTILSNAHRMQRLVDDLLDLSRIESGGWRPTRRLVDIASLAREAWAPFAAAAQERGIHFSVELSPAAATLAADPDALRQILTNLMDNALRYTRAGGAITVRADATADGVMVAVEDTGTGIAPEHLARIFERFYRADPSRSRAQGGTGLGLAIVKHLVEAHGGRVAAASTLGHGTSIQLVFPGEEAAA